MDEKNLAREGKVMRAIELMLHKNVKIATMAKTLKMDEIDVRAIVDQIKKK